MNSITGNMKHIQYILIMTALVLLAACSHDKVEELTGYDFLASLDDTVEDVIESKENIKDWPAYYPRR